MGSSPVVANRLSFVSASAKRVASRPTGSRKEGAWSERVIIVENDPSIREVASLGLRGAGLQVETAGAQALVD